MSTKRIGTNEQNSRVEVACTDHTRWIGETAKTPCMARWYMLCNFRLGHCGDSAGIPWDAPMANSVPLPLVSAVKVYSPGASAPDSGSKASCED